MWIELKDARDEVGYTFKDAIFSGCKYLNQKIGIYAGHISSYNKFSPLFEKAIEIIHKIPKPT